MTSNLKLLATLALIGATAVWGSTFILVKDLVRVLPVTDFLAVRFAIAALVMAALCHRHLRRLSRRGFVVSAALGAFYGFGQLLQTWGLEHTSASVSGFVTGMYVVLTPVLGWALLRDRVPMRLWAAVAVATVGLGLLSLHGTLIPGIGESLTLASAAVYALHILGLSRWSRPEEALASTVVQMTVVALICLVPALSGGIQLPTGVGPWVSMLFIAVVCSAAALLAQTWAQAHMQATRAAIVMTTEPVFAAIFAVWLGGETLGLRSVLGGSLVLIAMLLTEVKVRRKNDAPTEGLHHQAG